MKQFQVSVSVVAAGFVFAVVVGFGFRGVFFAFGGGRFRGRSPLFGGGGGGIGRRRWFLLGHGEDSILFRQALNKWGMMMLLTLFRLPSSPEINIKNMLQLSI